MNRKFIFFINPISGTNKKGALKPLIEQRLREKNLSFQFAETNRYGNYDFLPALIHEQSITDVVVCGGDGTVNQVASSLLKSPVQLGIIPMGSGNGLAFAAGIPKDAGKALDIILQGDALLTDAFYINQKFSCMLCGIGFDAQVAHDFAKQKSRGFATYAKQTLKNFFTVTDYPFVIDINGRQIDTRSFFISIANSNQFGNHVTIAPRASLNDGMLDIVVVNKMNKINFVFSVLKQIKSGKLQKVTEKDFEKRDIQYFQAKKLTIQNPSLAPLHIDGEPSETSSVFEIKIVENAFRLIQRSNGS